MAKNKKTHFPVFADIRGKTAVIIGGGTVAARRAEILCGFDLSVCVVAPQICRQIQELTVYENLRIIHRSYCADDLAGAFLVIAATDRREINREIGEICRENGTLVNVADCHEESSFYFPAIAKNAEITVGITGNGCCHKQVAQTAQAIRELIE